MDQDGSRESGWIRGIRMDQGHVFHEFFGRLFELSHEKKNLVGWVRGLYYPVI